jgi:alkylation response protein AidB-like acyl-CoA dehydrogenase
MDLAWTAQQQSLWDDIVQFAHQTLKQDDLAERDHLGTFSEANWQHCAKKGLFGFAMPEAYGGAGYDLVTSVHGLEALGYGCMENGFTLAINGQTWSVQIPILIAGTEAQKQKYLPRLIDGTWKGAHAVTEAESGSDAFSMTTTATKTDGGYVLNGTKMMVGMAPVADVYILFATLNPQLGRWGVTGFIVDAKTEGITTEWRKDKMGLRTEPFGSITLKDAFIPTENRLGNEGSGAAIFNAAIDYERCFIFTSHIGSIARQLDQAITYAKTRKQGGQPIGKYQSVSNRIADMKVRLEMARSFLYKAAWMFDNKQDMKLQAAMNKLVISELLVENSMDAIRVHGGRGYLSEFAAERDLRDVLGGVLYAGTSDIQRNLIAGLLGV